MTGNQDPAPLGDPRMKNVCSACGADWWGAHACPHRPAVIKGWDTEILTIKPGWVLKQRAYQELIAAVEDILEDGHMNQERLARLRLAYETVTA